MSTSTLHALIAHARPPRILSNGEIPLMRARKYPPVRRSSRICWNLWIVLMFVLKKSLLKRCVFGVCQKANFFSASTSVNSLESPLLVFRIASSSSCRFPNIFLSLDFTETHKKQTHAPKEKEVVHSKKVRKREKNLFFFSFPFSFVNE